MSPIYCDECGRANAAGANACIWCGLPILNSNTAVNVETTRVEIGYLDGIDRFEDPAPVRLIISHEWIEIAEVIPGTRSVKIPVSSIIEANSADASTMIEVKRVRPKRWWLRLRPGAFLPARTKAQEVKVHDYILAIKYTHADETRTAVFHREDPSGLAVVEGLARILNSIVRRNRRED